MHFLLAMCRNVYIIVIKNNLIGDWEMTIRAWVLGTILAVIGYRFKKYHRHNETWQYRYLHTTMANLRACQLTGREDNEKRNIMRWRMLNK
jgi:hypothetical protein